MSEQKKFALIIANAQYEDTLLRQLVAPSQDAERLANVLRNPDICGFQVQTLIDEPSYRASEEIEAFFAERGRDDLSLLYFSGHGVTDDDGLLYYATRNTNHKRLRATSVPAAFVNDLMSKCRSRRQVLLLDCCHSGAFARTKGVATADVARQVAEGRGRYVLTASDAFQYSFEGERVDGEAVCSVFTQAIIAGLDTGKADLDRDGEITIDELYRFVCDRVREQTPQQSPRKWESDAEGPLVIGYNPWPEEAPLPEDAVRLIASPIPETREKAIAVLEALLQGKHRGLQLAGKQALITLSGDDSRRVSNAAQAALDKHRSRTGPIVMPPTGTRSGKEPSGNAPAGTAQPPSSGTSTPPRPEVSGRLSSRPPALESLKTSWRPILTRSAWFGLLWAAVWLIGFKFTRMLTPEAQTSVATILGGAIIGFAVVRALGSYVDRLRGKYLTAIGASWVIAALLQFLLSSHRGTDKVAQILFWLQVENCKFQSIEIHISPFFTWIAWIFVVYMAPNVIAGAITGMCATLSRGDGWKSGVRVGALSFLVASVAGHWLSAVADNWKDPAWAGTWVPQEQYSWDFGFQHVYELFTGLVNQTFHKHWVVTSLLAFLEGAVGLAGLICFLRRKDPAIRKAREDSGPTPRVQRRPEYSETTSQ